MFDWTEEPGPWNEWRLFDEWRAKYDSMSLQDQTAFHSEFYKRWTVIHQHGDDAPADAFFNLGFHALPTRVLEIGGWTGEAAARILARHPNITEWRNVEICREAVVAHYVRDERYKPEVPTDWPWNLSYPGYNVLYMQHVLEHMRFEQFKSLMRAVPDAEWVFLQSPLDMEPRDWKGYPGCHILEVGWAAIDQHMESIGYTLVHTWWDTINSTAPENGRTRVYRRQDGER